MIKKAYVDTPSGQIHYAACGKGDPVLLLHQTPRSWDEYRDVLPILGRKFHAIAMDTVGFGSSYQLDSKATIEDYALAAIDFLDALDIEKTHLVGHHTGGVIAIELAATFKNRVKSLVLSSTPYIDVAERRKRQGKPTVDSVETKANGSHLTELWQNRAAFYPSDKPDLLTRYVSDCLRTGGKAEEGHLAVGSYQMEKRISLIEVDTLVMAGDQDPFSFPMLKVLAEKISRSKTKVIMGGKVPMVDQMPQEFADAVLSFLSSLNQG